MILGILEIYNIFNNRELAILTWAFLLLFYAICKEPSLLHRFWDIAKLASRFVVIYLTIVLYVVLANYILSELGLWSIELAKEIVYWSFGSGLIFSFSAIQNDADRLLEGVFKKTFAISILIVFLVKIPVFHYAIEFMLTFLIILLSAVGAVIYYQHKEHQSVLNFIMTMLGAVVLFYASLIMIQFSEEIFTFDSVLIVSMPAVMSITFIPALLAFRWLTVHQSNKHRAQYTRKR